MGRNLVASGIISRLVKPKGFGFIKCAGKYELYFHQSQVKGSTFASLTQGQSVVFKVGLNQKGLQAIEIEPITEISTNRIKNKNFLEKGATPLVQKPSRTGKPGGGPAKPETGSTKSRTPPKK